MSRPKESPPPYEAGGSFIGPAQPAYSYYPDDEFQHFYRWSSPPGIIKIMAIIVIVLCVAIFACVASSLAHDSPGAFSSMGGYMPGYGSGGYGSSYGGGSYGGSSYGGGYGGGSYGGMYADPRQGKGFFIALAVMVFIFSLVVFIIIVSHQRLTESRKFYLATAIICAILALLMLIGTIVYLMAVNPAAQATGSIMGNQIASMCAPYQQQQMMGPMVNQYLYYYCVVEPHEAVAVVFGFLATAALIIMVVFAVKTRQKISSFGKSNIFWKKVKDVEEVAPGQDVEAWVNGASGPMSEAAFSAYPEKRRGSSNYLDEENIYDKPPSIGTPQPFLEEQALQKAAPYNSSSELASSYGQPKKPRAGRPRRNNGQDYDTDYNSSGDELDDDDFDSEYPPIKNEQERNDYKREFDRDHQEYKNLQADLDKVNRRLSELDEELDQLEEGSPQFLDAMDEYNAVKSSKKTPDYLVKKRRCKYLKAKLSHIKKMVSDYDRRG
ncbi:occludin [Oryzias latipes]|uniref:occludin n=1 Tax=Oryzias latipes TaxID=8090 RepID=UPI0002A47DC8|nr:occludin [Oryzias latipes]